MPTPAELREQAAKLREQAARSRTDAAEKRRQAAFLERDADYDEDEARVKEGRAKSAEAEAAGLPLVANDATITQPMEAQKTSPSSKSRPGRRFDGPSPLKTAFDNSGKGIGEIAVILGVPEGTVKSWNKRKRAPKEIRDRLAKKPFFVPDSDWET